MTTDDDRAEAVLPSTPASGGPKPYTQHPITRERQLHRSHFAFLRACCQGVEPARAWALYLAVEGEYADTRTVCRMLRWLGSQLAALAKREGLAENDTLVRLEWVRQPRPKPARLPSLDEFAEAHGLEHLLEADLLAKYTATYPKQTAQDAQRQSALTRALAELQKFEVLAAKAPQASDRVGAWFDAGLAARLRDGGTPTLAALFDHINGIGRRWWGGFAGIGVTKAARIEHWLQDNQASLGMTIGAHVAQPRNRLNVVSLNTVVPAGTSILPLEKFRVPAAFDGSAGRFRQPQDRCLLDARNDYEAILAWLGSKRRMTPEQIAQHQQRRRGGSGPTVGGVAWLQYLTHTQRSYRKEAERFLLWAVLVRHKPLSSMTLEDCVAYRDFLADPQPRERWCGDRARERWSPLWRPFNGPLSLAAQRQTLMILKNLYRFWIDQNYISGNPWSGVTLPVALGPSINPNRSFSAAQWATILQQLSQQGDTPVARRLQFTVKWLYATGLRLSEVVASRGGDLRWVEYPAGREGEKVSGWLLQVVGKGDKLRSVPVPTALIDELGDLLQQRGLPRNPDHPDNARVPLLGRAQDTLGLGAVRAQDDSRVGQGATVDAEQTLASSTLYRQLKGFFAQCAEDILETDPQGAAQFTQASVHWLRHTHASHAVAQDMPLEIVQQNLGHASLATTTVYVHSEDKRRMRALQAFWQGTQYDG